MELHIPITRPRHAGPNAVVRIVRLRGVTIAAPSPCMARAAMWRVVLGARAQAAEARLNSARPATYTRRRPKRSPMLAGARRGDDPGGKDEQVGADRPLQGGDLPAQLTVDGGQGGDHQGVEGHHEEGDRGEEQRPACPGGLLGGYGQGWGHRLPLLVGARAVRPVRVVIRTGRDICCHCRQPGGRSIVLASLRTGSGESFGFSVHPRSVDRGPGAWTEAQKPMSAPRQLGRTPAKGGCGRGCRRCSPR
jgi:hypothetical protein